MDAAIKVENLSKVFHNKKEHKEIWALDNISFEVQKGQVFGLLGPNGAGKTTTIRLLAGLIKPTTGRAYVFDQDVQTQPHIIRKRIGFLTENHGNYENLSVFDNLKFFGSFYDLPNLTSRIHDILKQLDLYERKDLKAGKLSKGQKQRLAIARVLIHNPEILFFDEPTSGLDPQAAVKLRNLIATLKTKDRTIFINSHNLEEVQKLSDRVAILDQGKIKRIGTPAELSKELWDTQETMCVLKYAVSSQLKAKLESLKIIKQLRVDQNKLYIYTDNADESTPLIIKTLVEMNADILEVHHTVHSLEDIYLKLMEKEPNPLNGGDSA